MKTTRFRQPDIQFSGAGLIITGKCYDDKAVFIPYLRIKNLEFNKNLLDDSCGVQEDHYFIVCENDEYYEIEGRACDIAKSLLLLLANLK